MPNQDTFAARAGRNFSPIVNNSPYALWNSNPDLLKNWINYQPTGDFISDPNSPLNAPGSMQYANQAMFNDPNAPDMQTLINNSLPGSETKDNIYTKGWIDGSGTWHPFGNMISGSRSLGNVSSGGSTGPATQSINGSPYVPVNASEGNPNYSPFNTQSGPASQTSTQAYDQSGNPTAPSTELPNMTFGNRYLQGTNYAPGDPNAPAGMGGRFWQTLEQNQAGWQPSPTAQDLMAKNIPQPASNTFNLAYSPQANTQTPNSILQPAPAKTQPQNTGNPGTSVNPLFPQSQAQNNPLFQSQYAPQSYYGSPSWSAMRGMR